MSDCKLLSDDCDLHVQLFPYVRANIFGVGRVAAHRVTTLALPWVSSVRSLSTGAVL
jgi:hypothetical protein